MIISKAFKSMSAARSGNYSSLATVVPNTPLYPVGAADQRQTSNRSNNFVAGIFYSSGDAISDSVWQMAQAKFITAADLKTYLTANTKTVFSNPVISRLSVISRKEDERTVLLYNPASLSSAWKFNRIYLALTNSSSIPASSSVDKLPVATWIELTAQDLSLLGASTIQNADGTYSLVSDLALGSLRFRG